MPVGRAEHDDAADRDSGNLCVRVVVLCRNLLHPGNRAPGARALTGGGAVAFAGAGVEALAHAQGWWSYTSADTPYGPLALFPFLVAAFAFLALIGWRVARRFGSAGLGVFLGILAVVGTLRDYLLAGKVMGLIVFAPGVVLVIIDAFLWLGLTALSIAVMRAVSGPARDDAFARPRGNSV